MQNDGGRVKTHQNHRQALKSRSRQLRAVVVRGIVMDGAIIGKPASPGHMPVAIVQRGLNATVSERDQNETQAKQRDTGRQYSRDSGRRYWTRFGTGFMDAIHGRQSGQYAQRNEVPGDFVYGAADSPFGEFGPGAGLFAAKNKNSEHLMSVNDEAAGE